jgi:hypothetical protein
MNPTPEELRRAMIAEMDASFEQVRAYLSTLSDQEWQGPTDDEGWTIQDHVIHMAVWAGSMVAVAEKQPRWEALGVDRDTWKTIKHDYDRINAAVQRRFQGWSRSQVWAEFERSHQALVEKASTMTIANLERPYSEYQDLAENQNEPLYAYMSGNSIGHYDEHLGYIRAILGDL